MTCVILPKPFFKIYLLAGTLPLSSSDHKPLLITPGLGWEDTCAADLDGGTWWKLVELFLLGSLLVRGRVKQNITSGILPFSLKSPARFPMLSSGQGLRFFFTICAYSKTSLCWKASERMENIPGHAALWSGVAWLVGFVHPEPCRQ